MSQARFAKQILFLSFKKLTSNSVDAEQDNGKFEGETSRYKKSNTLEIVFNKIFPLKK